MLLNYLGGKMKTNVLMPIGIQGVGKSTFLRNYIAEKKIARISRDDIRTEVNGGEATFIPENEPRIWEIALQRIGEVLQVSLGEGAKIISLDMTNIDRKSRKPFFEVLVEFAKSHPIILRIFNFSNDVDLAMQRQATRSRKVEREIVKQYAAKREEFSPSEIQGNNVEIHIYDVNIAGEYKEVIPVS